MIHPNQDKSWSVWFACTGGLYSAYSTDEVRELLSSGLHQITQIHARPLPPLKGPMGGECTCRRLRNEATEPD